MLSTLRDTIEDLAGQFADHVLKAIREMSLDEVVAMTQRLPSPHVGRRSPLAENVATAPAPRRRGGRLHRRSASEIDATVDKIVSLVKQHRKGLRAEQIRAQLGLRANEMPRPIEAALASKRLSKKGQKRATTYFARG
jgi:hypothetical protein